MNKQKGLTCIGKTLLLSGIKQFFIGDVDHGDKRESEFKPKTI